MNPKFVALLLVAVLGLPISANALETDELIALTAMPLVVAAASQLTDVPADELMSVISTLNNAAVPPSQFVEVVRYAPVAIVSPAEPRFSTFVTTEYARGITGAPLALAIADEYPIYGVEEIHIVDPPVLTYIEQRTILPDVVVTRFEPQPWDPLALIAMPLAVAAVSDATDVPASDLIAFIAALNRAHVPAPQFVEVVRYSPVVLMRDDRPVFLRSITTEIDRGVVGRPFAFALADRIGVREIDVVRPRMIIDRDRDDEVILPTVVTPRRVVAVRDHPHGAPPGQVKKEHRPGTGVEAVRGEWRGRPSDQTLGRIDRNRPRDRSDDRESGRVTKPRADDSDRGKDRGRGHGHGPDKGKGKDKGKG